MRMSSLPSQHLLPEGSDAALWAMPLSTRFLLDKVGLANSFANKQKITAL